MSFSDCKFMLSYITVLLTRWTIGCLCVTELPGYLHGQATRAAEPLCRSRVFGKHAISTINQNFT